VAIAGAGSVVQLYLPVFKHLPEAELVALADLREDRLAQLAARYSVPRTYTDVRQLAADPDIDAVVIVTPPNLHAEHTEACAAGGKHVLCEKPMADTVDGCLRMTRACRHAGVKLQIAHMKRFMRGNQMVKSIVDSGTMGRIFMAECHWDCAVPGLDPSHRGLAATGGGNLQDHGPHAFDLIRWWTGNDIQQVAATVRCVHPGRPNEDTAAAILDHENGLVTCCHMTRVSYGREHYMDLYRLYGTGGTLVVRNNHHFPTTSLELPEITLYRPGEIIQRYDSAHPHSWNLDDAAAQNNPFLNQMKAFLEAILTDEEPRVTGEDGTHVMEAVTAAYVSSLRGEKISLPMREQVDLQALFEQIKERDARDLRYDYSLEGEPKSPGALPMPSFAFRPPRTKEQWSDREHGMVDDAVPW